MTECNHIWIKAEGNYAITKVEVNGDNYTFVPSKGIIAEVKICTNCGELKIFSSIVRGNIE